MQLKDYRKKKVYYEDLSFLGKKKKEKRKKFHYARDGRA